MWSRAAADGVYSMVAISRTLAAEGTSLARPLRGLRGRNLSPARTYAEGIAATAGPAGPATYTLASSTPGTGRGVDRRSTTSPAAATRSRAELEPDRRPAR